MKPIPQALNPKRILIIKPSAIGDVVHGLPILNLLHQRFPAAQISWLVTPACAGILQGHPMLHEVICFERRRFGKAWKNPRALVDLYRFTRGLRRRRFDLVVDLQGLFRSGWLAFRTGAPIRIGLASAREGAPVFYTHRVAVDAGDQHAIERYLSVTEALGCPRSPVAFPFATTQSDREAARQLVGGARPYAVLLPGSNWLTKRWPVERFAALVEPLRREFGLHAVFAGSPDERGLCQQAVEQAGRPAKNLAGQTTLGQLTALLEQAAIVIANDSGPMHIASALNRPLVAIFGPTNPLRTGPYGRLDCVVRLDLPCSPCYSRTCSHQSCMRWLEVGSVLSAVRRQLDLHPASLEWTAGAEQDVPGKEKHGTR